MMAGGGPPAGFARRLHRRRLERHGAVPSLPRRPPDRDLRRRGGGPRHLDAACTPPRSPAAGPACCTATAPTCSWTTTARSQDAHSISAGLDYPGIGPEHAWLHEVGRVTYLSATDDEALEAFQLLSRLEGIIPALEPAHALAKVHGARARRCRRITSWCVNLSGRGDKDIFAVAEHLGGEHVTTRIEARFRKCRAEGRAALVTYRDGRRSRSATPRSRSSRPAEGRRRHHRVRHAVHRPDGRRPGDPGRRPARAARRADDCARTLDLVRRFRDDGCRHARRSSWATTTRSTSTASTASSPTPRRAGVDGLIVVDLPPGGGRRALPAGARRPALPSSASPRRRPTTSACPPCSRTRRASSITSRSPASPARQRRISRKVAAAVERIKRHTPLPVVVGFGVKTGAHAAPIAKGADGVVVGSALVDAVQGLARRGRQGDLADGRGRHHIGEGSRATGVRSVVKQKAA